MPVRCRTTESKRRRSSSTARVPSDCSDVSTVSGASALQSTPGASDDRTESSLSSISAGDDEVSEGDSSETATDDSSDDDEEEDVSEDEIVTLGGPKRPQIDPKRVLEEAQKLQARLQELLPKLRKANEHLAEKGGSLNIEDVGDNQQHIEMNLGLGVLEEQQDSEDEDAVIKESSSGTNHTVQESTCGTDVMQSLLGADQNQPRPGIEEVGGD